MQKNLICYVFVAFANATIALGCWAESATESVPANAIAPTDSSVAKSTKSIAPLGSPKKTASAPLGKPKFAIKTSSPLGGGAGALAPDRAAEVKRLIDAYDNLAIRYYYLLTVAKTPEEIEAINEKHEPSEKVVRSFARLLSHIVSVDPKDEPALDALLFLNKYVGLPEVDGILAATPVESGEYSASHLDPVALLLEFHADNPKLAALLKTLPPGESTNTILQELFKKTHNPEVRAASGIRLVMTLQQMSHDEEAEQIALVMSEDRYLDGVPITGRADGPTARDWAEGKLRELRLLGIGQVLPEVSGETLTGDTSQITDYRGKVVVLDVWTTWCGPCAAMIPHEVEMTERLKDKPFALLSVSCDAEKETLTKYLEGTPMPWDHWWVGMDSEFSKTLNISSFPTVLVLDAQGVIRYKNIKDEKLEEAVNALLAEIEQSSTEEQN